MFSHVKLIVFIVLVLLVSMLEDLIARLFAQGSSGYFQETFHHVVAAETWTPEVVETQPNSVGVGTSTFAGAIPWMALMAGALALLAVYWMWNLIACDAHDLVEDNLEVPTLDSTLETEDLENSDEEDDAEDETESFQDEEDDKEECCITEEFDSSDDQNEDEQLKVSKVHRENMEDLLEEAREEILRLQTEGRELKREIENLSIEKESALEKANELSLRLKETEAINQALSSEKECFKRTNEDLRNALVKKDMELLERKATEADDNDSEFGIVENLTLDFLQRQLELTEAENFSLRDRATCYEAQLLASNRNLGNLHPEQLNDEKLKFTEEMKVSEVHGGQEPQKYVETTVVRKEDDLTDQVQKEEEEQSRKDCNAQGEKDCYEIWLEVVTLMEKNLKMAEDELQRRRQEEAMNSENKTLDNETLDISSGEQEPQKCVETTVGRKEEDLTDQMQKEEEEQSRKDCNAQGEKDCYEIWLEVVTLMERNLKMAEDELQRRRQEEAINSENKTLDNETLDISSEEQEPQKCLETTVRRKEEDLTDQMQKEQEEQSRKDCNAQGEKDFYEIWLEVVTQMERNLKMAEDELQRRTQEEAMNSERLDENHRSQETAHD
ncbi:trichohyalin-like [Macrobrachium rosenbergii]|uniref:trichohyalin-like n=1 Tax=Macrobrachium rosenbergii TaxID=79674 RepID=UPI0034D62C5E